MYDQNMIDHNASCKRTELFYVHVASENAGSASGNGLPVPRVTNPCIWTGLDDPRLFATLLMEVKTGETTAISDTDPNSMPLVP